jgi:hypothetical protein
MNHRQRTLREYVNNANEDYRLSEERIRRNLERNLEDEETARIWNSVRLNRNNGRRNMDNLVNTQRINLIMKINRLMDASQIYINNIVKHKNELSDYTLNLYLRSLVGISNMFYDNIYELEAITFNIQPDNVYLNKINKFDRKLKRVIEIAQRELYNRNR